MGEPSVTTNVMAMITHFGTLFGVNEGFKAIMTPTHFLIFLPLLFS